MISQKTLVPIGAVLVILGAIFWLGTLHSDVRAMRDSIEELSLEIKTGRTEVLLQVVKNRDDIIDLRERVSRVESKTTFREWNNE